MKLVVPKSKRVPYLNRYNETSQNVLVVCDFDIRFTFMLSGWPGSIHDMRVFKDAMTTYHHKFPHRPPGLLLELSCNNFLSNNTCLSKSHCAPGCLPFSIYREVLCG